MRNAIQTAQLFSVLFLVPAASAQTLPWIQYQDFSSDAVCGLIHAANAELVVLAGTGQMAIVSGPDVALSDVTVDESGNVFFEGQSAGFIEFDEDGEGDRALFWLTLTGRLVEIGAFDASPQPSEDSPADIRNAGCDPCPQWDDQSICADDNENGNGNDNSSGGSPLAGLCGSGAGTAAALLMLGLTLVGFLSAARRTDGRLR